MKHKRSSTLQRTLFFVLRLYIFGSVIGIMNECSSSSSSTTASAFVASIKTGDNTISSTINTISDANVDLSNETLGNNSKPNEVPTEATASSVVTETGTMEGSVPLLLPPSDNDENITSIQLGETISFTELGPIILNTDGTIRRIDNWKELSKQEQEVTWRRIKKRNAERRELLLLQQNEESGQKNGVEQLENNSNIEL
jgi:hypothetical protein